MSQYESEINPRYDDPETYSGRNPPDWEARRKAVYRRDDWTCQNCGRQSGPYAGDDGERLHAHHIQARADGGSNRLSNLETLCEPCHQNNHDHDIFQDGWVGDGPRVYRIGPARASLRGGLAALIMSVWVGLFGRLLAYGGGIQFGSLEDETVWVGIPTVIVLAVLLSKPLFVTTVLGLGAAGITAIVLQGVGVSIELLSTALLVWPPILIGVWALWRGHLH
ncbi:HNH endonuclease [Saliphagus infecundisoli]|uniref:HNH endonuclease n=1 Tax=Saliphagus infecundisoli TaxID=1849069 RepID=A0ABD5QL42_9EURY|nr:HNH endonuclease [Saliphagus infecundisoli]